MRISNTIKQMRALIVFLFLSAQLFAASPDKPDLTKVERFFWNPDQSLVRCEGKDYPVGIVDKIYSDDEGHTWVIQLESKDVIMVPYSAMERSLKTYQYYLNLRLFEVKIK